MKKVLLVLMLLPCVGWLSCAPRHQRGGAAETDVPKLEDKTVRMKLTQPENPEGSSSMSSNQVVTTIMPDGTVIVNKVETATEIGGSQDMAKILKEYSSSEHFRNLLAALGLTVAAWFMYKKDWPVVCCILLIGACCCLFWSWWAAPITLGVSFAAAVGHWKTSALKLL